MAEDKPDFDHRQVQADVNGPNFDPTKNDPTQSFAFKMHRHDGKDAQRILWSNIAGPLPGSMSAIGQVQSTALTVGLNGWSVASSGTGIYTVTHNMGGGSYVVVVNPISTICFPVSTAKTANSFTVKFYDAAGTLTNSDFIFHLVRVS